VGEGTGLGLFVSYAIVEKCGGHIRLETRLQEADGADHGTTFFVPLQPEITEADNETEQQAAA
jgi:signal transduction histidine kinase